MSELAGRQCEACRADAPRVAEDRVDTLLAQIPAWEIVDVDGVKQLRRVFRCKNFVDALALAARFGELAEQENHHPALLVEWGKLTVTWWTHKIKGLHENDFIMAARCDQLESH